MVQQIEQRRIGSSLTPDTRHKFELFQRSMVKHAPLLGHHTDQALPEELGLSSPEIGCLRDQGIVADNYDEQVGRKARINTRLL